MIALFATVFAASLVGSLHCAGMCGGLVAFYSGSDPARGLRRAISHTAYNGGRLFSYLALGTAAGLLGAALDLAGSLAGVQRTAALIAGATMILWGAVALLRLRGFSAFAGPGAGPLGALVRKGFKHIGQRPPVVRALAVGLLTGLLPCGWLWAFLVTAAGTGSALGGAAVMGVFWLGTVPVLLAVGLGVQLVGGRLRQRVPALTAILLVVLGLSAVLGRPPALAAHVAARQATTAEAAPQSDHSGLPCCE